MINLEDIIDDDLIILGIDPGTSNLGVSVFKIDASNFKINSVEAFTLKADKLLSSEWVGSFYTERTRRLYALKNMLSKIFDLYKPASIVCESGYINMRQPGAFGALSECVYMIRSAVIEYDQQCSLNMIEPSNVKKAVKAGWISNKDSVKEALLNIDEINSVCLSDINILDEHSVDSICVTYAYLLKLRGDKC